MSSCRGCGVALNKDQVACPYCGRTNEEYQPPDKPTNKSDTTCPYCHLSDRTEKVTEIRRHDIHQLIGTVPVSHTSIDKDGKSYSYTSQERFTGTQSSDLANALTPPIEPQLPKVHGAGTWWLLALLIYPGVGLFAGPIAMVVGMGIEGENYLAIAFSIVIALVGIWVWALLLSRWKKLFNKEILEYPKKSLVYFINHSEWESAIKRWQQLYYCYRDGHVFVPGCEDSAPIDKMMSYIYQKEGERGVSNTSDICPKHRQNDRNIRLYSLFQNDKPSGSALVSNKRSLDDLRNHLAPLPIPTVKIWGDFYFGWWLLGFFSIGLIFPIFLWWKAYKRALAEKRKPPEKLMSAWKIEMKSWTQLLYCPDCDIVFDPKTSKIYDFSGDFKQYLLSLV